MLLWCQSSVHPAEDEDQKTLLLPYLQEDGRLKSSFSCFYFQLSFSSLEFESYCALRLPYAGCDRINYIVHCKEHGCLALCAWEESLIKQVNCNIVFYTWTACTVQEQPLALLGISFILTPLGLLATCSMDRNESPRPQFQVLIYANYMVFLKWEWTKDSTEEDSFSFWLIDEKSHPITSKVPMFIRLPWTVAIHLQCHWLGSPSSHIWKS